MDTLTILLIAVGLAMDAFAVSIASGVVIQKGKLKRAFLFGFFFGGFQMGMPVLGWAAGYTFRDLITGVDHWIAFGLLAFIGGKMLYEAARFEAIEKTPQEITPIVLLGLAIATSIDALAVGISFSFLQVSIIFPVLIIGLVTFVMSLAGIFIGHQCGKWFERKIESLGGIILILIGVKILVSHLMH